MSDKVMDLIRHLPNRLRQIRQNKGLSQENMADALGISTTAYGDLERGKTEITLMRLGAIATIFQVPLENLLGLEQGPTIDELLAENRRLNRENTVLIFRNKLLESRLKSLLETQKDRQRIGF
ncbi:MAG: helix-turn-helix domain-containing protein [Spirosomataceae bacterium]